MADIHGIPDESMMVPEQSFTSEPLPDLSGVTAAAEAVAAARLAQCGPLLDSPAGSGAVSVTDGFTGGWPGSI